MQKTIITFLFFIILTACATPTVVNVIGPNDNKLTCEELSKEIEIANKYANEAQEAKKAGKPHNIGAVLFFLPGLGFSMANIDEASKAAKDRAAHLNELKEKKNC